MKPSRPSNKEGMSMFAKLVVVMLAAILSVPALADAPNIVIVLRDDVGTSTLAPYETPNLDRIANAGMTLTGHYAEPMCTPSRAALLTGRQPLRSGTQSNFSTSSLSGMSVAERTMADILRESGYSTAMFGKWHLGRSSQTYWPTQRGFDHAVWHQSGMTEDTWTTYYDNDVLFSAPKKSPEAKLELSRITSNIYNNALAWMWAQPGPFFAYIAEAMMHMPYKCAEPLPDESVAACAARESDVALGSLYDALPDNTLLLVVGDNGAVLEIDNAPFRGKKFQMLEGGIRTPAVIAGPGIPVGSVSTEPVWIGDWLPTFVNLAGAQLPTDRVIDGHDVGQVVNGSGTRPSNMFWFEKALRVGCDKFIAKSANVPEDVLYNVCSDQSELTPVIDPERQSVLKQEFLTLRTAYRETGIE